MDNFSRNKIIGIIAVVFILMICCCGGIVNIFNDTDKTDKNEKKKETAIKDKTTTKKEKPTSTSTPTPTATPTPIKTPVEYKNIAYNELARYPEKYKKQFFAFSGKIIQVIEDGDNVNFRIEVDGDYNKVIYCIYTYIDKTKGRILDDDNVDFKGMFTGLTTYKSTMGGNITIPAMILTDINVK